MNIGGEIAEKFILRIIDLQDNFDLEEKSNKP